jgi:hypothetical protein
MSTKEKIEEVLELMHLPLLIKQDLRFRFKSRYILTDAGRNTVSRNKRTVVGEMRKRPSKNQTWKPYIPRRPL